MFSKEFKKKNISPEKISVRELPIGKLGNRGNVRYYHNYHQINNFRH